MTRFLQGSSKPVELKASKHLTKQSEQKTFSDNESV